jgi:hypothetical protein
VVFRDGQTDHRGRVVAERGRRREVMTDAGLKAEVPASRLRASADRALILEGRLESNLRSRRVYGPLMRRFLSSYDVEAMYEKIHTQEDLRRFLARYARSPGFRFVHLICHGQDPKGSNSAHLVLTFDTVVLPANAGIFEKLNDKIIIFSCCKIGADKPALAAVKKASGAAAIIAYRRSVYDNYALLAESLFYDQVIDQNQTPARAVERANRALRDIGCRHPDEKTRLPVMVCI